MLNLTREFPTPAEPPPPFPPVPTPHVHHPEPPPQTPPPQTPPPPPEAEESHPEAEEPHPEEEESNDDEKVVAGVVEGESENDGGGGTAGFVHGVLCTSGFLIVLPSGALVARYAKVTGSSRAFRLHRLLQFGLGSFAPSILPFNQILTCAAGMSIAGGTLAYLFMDNCDSGGVAHKVSSDTSC